MSAPGGPVVVEVDPAHPGDHAVRWAAREADLRGCDLHIALPRDPRRDLGCHAAYVHARSIARAVAPRVVAWARPDEHSPGRAGPRAVEAGMRVVGGPPPRVDELIRTATCPIVLVPATAAGHQQVSADASVVLAAGPGTGPDVLAFAFTEASRRRVELLAVRTWKDPLVDLGLLLPNRIARWDAANEQVRAELAQQLSACTQTHPDVRVRTLVVNDSCTEMLAALAYHAALMIFGRPGHGNGTYGTASSPALAMARRLPCPVVIVAGTGPTRREQQPGWEAGPPARSR